jgi:amidohydrolase
MDQLKLNTLIAFRKSLHQNPEVSGKEVNTAKKVKEFFQSYNPDQILEKIGGQGIAFIYNGHKDGPTTMIRCELDGLPILEANDFEHTSTTKGVFHGCGHDGHMAILAGVGMHLSENRPHKGKVVLLYQPAEETGEGAEKVLNSKKFQKLNPDYAFALHNLPGFIEKQIIFKEGPFAAASKGMILHLKGKTSHAAHPEDGKSPAEAMCKIIIALEKLPHGIDKFTLLTIVHAKLGSVAFGTSPGDATVMATLRAYEDDALDQLTKYAEKLVTQIAEESELEINISYRESFAATVNDPEAFKIIKKAAENLKLNSEEIGVPFRWSEDFGHFSKGAKTTLVGLGAGENQPQLHEPTYDFPDGIMSTGIELFIETIKEINH